MKFLCIAKNKMKLKITKHNPRKKVLKNKTGEFFFNVLKERFQEN